MNTNDYAIDQLIRKAIIDIFGNMVNPYDIVLNLRISHRYYFHITANAILIFSPNAEDIYKKMKSIANGDIGEKYRLHMKVDLDSLDIFQNGDMLDVIGYSPASQKKNPQILIAAKALTKHWINASLFESGLISVPYDKIMTNFTVS